MGLHSTLDRAPKQLTDQSLYPRSPGTTWANRPWLVDALTTYAADGDFVLPSIRLKGTKPPRANMLVADHLQPAARKAGIVGPIGFHTLRRTLASALVSNGSDVRLVQELLRHSNPVITLDAYARSTTPAKLEAQGWVMNQLLAEDVKAALLKAKPASSRAM